MDAFERVMPTSVWLDKKYINLVASHLPRFAWKTASVANFRCILCGDSQQHKTKARAYLFIVREVGYMMKCHNCGVSLPFGAFLKRLSQTLFSEYLMEKFETRINRTPAPAESPAPPAPPTLAHEFPDVHTLASPELPGDLLAVRQYVEGRRLPPSALQRLAGTTRAYTWLSPLVGADKAARVADDIPYLVIPMRLPSGQFYAAQLRPLGHKDYITFRWGHDSLRAFGLEAIDPQQTVYCLEGPLDALCLPNAIALCGSDILGGLVRISDAGYPLVNRVLVWDNEPRSKEITRHIHRGIAAGERVVLWPHHLPKDANDMLAAGHDVLSIITTHTYHGLQAELEFQQWRH